MLNAIKIKFKIKTTERFRKQNARLLEISFLKNVKLKTEQI